MTSVVTGGSGMLGSALVDHLENNKVHTICPVRSQLDLEDHESVKHYFDRFLDSNVESVFHLAAHVGGVKANSNRLATFFEKNCRINVNILSECAKHRIPKVISAMSTCVYPDTPFVTLPLTENQLHVGTPHDSNFGYAFAKRMIDVHTRAIRNQFNLPYITVIPNNLFGKNDNFHLEDGHVIPALIRKVWEAKLANTKTFEVWGDGSPLREFTYADDAAKILKIVAEEYDDEIPLNIGCTEEHSIKSVVEIICELLEYEGDIVYNVTKPMGQHKKPSSNQRLISLTSWKAEDYTPFRSAMKETCDWFVINYPHVRPMNGVTK